MRLAIEIVGGAVVAFLLVCACAMLDYRWTR